MTGASGGSGYSKYIYEASFKAGGTPVRGFGKGVKVSASEAKNNTKKLYGLGSQDAEAIVDGPVEGNLSVEWALTNPWFLPAILGGSMGTPSGAGPYVWSPAFANALPSMCIEKGLELGATDYVVKYSGVVASSLTLQMEVGNTPVMAKMECEYADSDSSTSGTYGTPATDTETAVFNFAMGKIEIPTATAVGETDKASVTIKRNPKLVKGCGNRKATTHWEGQREYSVELTTLLQSTTLLEKFYGNTGSSTTPEEIATTEISSILIGFSNDGWGTADADSRRLEITLSGCKIETYGDPFETENGVMVSLKIECRTMSVSVTNNTSGPSKPADVP